MKEDTLDLVIVGAGAVGMAMAYEARRHGRSCLLLEKAVINEPAKRYWSSNFSARQNRVQYSEAYLSNYVLESNKYWDEIDAERKAADPTAQPLKHVEGSVWFGSKEVSSNEGNLYAGNQVLDQLDVPKLYMESLVSTQPSFFRNFNFSDK